MAESGKPLDERRHFASENGREILMPDVVVVGAGATGASVAFHLAERGADVLVVDRDGPAAGPTARSAALVRAHYPTALEADLAWESLTEYFERWNERVGGGCGFTRTGFAFLASEDGVGDVAANVSMLREQTRVETRMISAEELADIEPSMTTQDVSSAAYEPRGGYADPAATAISLLAAARRKGARFERRRALDLLERGDRITGVRTAEGSLEAPNVVLCAGAWSAPLASTVGLGLPIRPARVQLALFERPFSLPTHLTVIDAIEDITFRPTADRCTLVSARLSELEWLDSPDRYEPANNPEFVESARRRIAHRIPSLRDAPYRLGWVGVLDMTPDGRPMLGPAGPEGLFLCAGWSGKGFKKAPAVGAEVAGWVLEGSPERKGLRSYNAERFEAGKLIHGEHEYGVRTPH